MVPSARFEMVNYCVPALASTDLKATIAQTRAVGRAYSTKIGVPLSYIDLSPVRAEGHSAHCGKATLLASASVPRGHGCSDEMASR